MWWIISQSAAPPTKPPSLIPHIAGKALPITRHCGLYDLTNEPANELWKSFTVPFLEHTSSKVAILLEHQIRPVEPRTFTGRWTSVGSDARCVISSEPEINLTVFAESTAQCNAALQINDRVVDDEDGRKSCSFYRISADNRRAFVGKPLAFQWRTTRLLVIAAGSLQGPSGRARRNGARAELNRT